MYMAEFLHCLPETITTLLLGCTPIQNKKFKKGYICKYLKDYLFSYGDNSQLYQNAH